MMISNYKQIYTEVKFDHPEGVLYKRVVLSEYDETDDAGVTRHVRDWHYLPKRGESYGAVPTINTHD